MPQYCRHCGAIETPTWRRIYVKECEGKPSPLDEAEGEGETIGLEITERDEDTAKPTKFLIRKSMKKTKDSQPGPGFEDVTLCNPCGLWFNKFKVMRPPDKWGRKALTRKSKKQKENEGPGFSTDGVEPQSDAFFTDLVVPEEAAEDADGEGEGQTHTRVAAAPARSHRPRANSLQMQPVQSGRNKGELNASQLDAALARAVQSSPVRFNGSQASPIEIDDMTPKPTRRLLFPSPRKDGEVKSLDDNAQASLKAMPPFDAQAHDKPGIEINFDNNDTSVFEAFTYDKENLAPTLGEGEDDFSHLFDGSPSAFFKTPRKTPAKNFTTPRSTRQLRHLLKTPTPGRSGKRKPLTPNPNAANGATFENNNGPAVNDFMTSPSSSRYFLRSTPSRLSRTGNTPVRGSNGGGSNEISPFSNQLAQMLSESNDSNQFTSPTSGAAFDFSDLPSFTTPGGRIAQEWEGLEGMLSSEFADFDSGL
jgi:hypothetical protein